MSLPCITMPSVEVPYFDGTNFVSCKSQMSSYLRKMNPQDWWMVDIGFSHAMEDCLYLEAHASNALSNALNAEIEDIGEMEYGLLERANLLWKALEQMFVSSNNKRSSSTNVQKSISSSSMNIDQDQEEQSRVKKEKVNSISLGKSNIWFPKLEYPVLAEQKLTWLKKMITPCRVPMMTMMMMILTMNIMIKSSCWSFKNS
jgi:hypothetical protein